MDYGVMIIGTLGVGLLLWWIMLEPLKGQDGQKLDKPVLPSDTELNKLTKAKIEELGRELGVELDKRKTKANMIEDLKQS